MSYPDLFTWSSIRGFLLQSAGYLLKILSRAVQVFAGMNYVFFIILMADLQIFWVGYANVSLQPAQIEFCSFSDIEKLAALEKKSHQWCKCFLLFFPAAITIFTPCVSYWFAVSIKTGQGNSKTPPASIHFYGALKTIEINLKQYYS